MKEYQFEWFGVGIHLSESIILIRRSTNKYGMHDDKVVAVKHLRRNKMSNKKKETKEKEGLLINVSVHALARGCNQQEITPTWRMGRRVWWKCKWMRRASRCFRRKGKQQKKSSRSFVVSCKCIQFRRRTPGTCRALRG